MINPVIYDLELALRKEERARRWPWRGGRWASQKAHYQTVLRER